MKQTLKFMLLLAVIIGAVLLLRQYVCTVVTVTDNQLVPQFRAGDRVLVNRLSRNNLQKGDWVMFADSAQHIGRIASMPGDTITVDTLQYEIPTQTCTQCNCKENQIFLVEMGKNRTFTHQRNVKGKALRLFNLKVWL